MAATTRRILVCNRQCPPGYHGGDRTSVDDTLALLQALIGELDRRRLWDRVAVDFEGCPSPCSRGPALLLYPEGVLYNAVAPTDLPDIIARHFAIRARAGKRSLPPASGAAGPAPSGNPGTGELTHYFIRYKYLFHHHRLAEAEAAAREGLAAAAAQAGIPTDWRRLTAVSASWTTAGGPERFYLFSLKALAFIRLRRGDTEESRALLDKLSELDPADQVGAEVIRALLHGAVDAA
jgi:(2Fe-2S) ferredoxin